MKNDAVKRVVHLFRIGFFLFAGFSTKILSGHPIDTVFQVSWATCQSTCSGTLGSNIFPNGDFGSGIPNIFPTNPGIAPGYNYQLNPPPNDGWYCITNNTSSWGSFAASRWIKIEDNGPEPNGYMMVVNASYQPGLFYQKTVEVCELTTYEFSIDVINLFKSAFPNAIKPNLSFLLDGVEVCETGNIPSDEQWHTSRFSFTTAPGQTSILLALRNNAPGGNGNDLAIDNISFRACGPEIMVSDTVFFCPGSIVTLEPSLSNFPFSAPTYQWQVWSDSVWVSLPAEDSTTLVLPSAVAGQQYRLLVASALGNLELANCRVASAPITLAYSYTLPVGIGLDSIPCPGDTGGASASVIGGTSPFVYNWSNGANTSVVSGLEAGWYAVTVTDGNGCTGSASAMLPSAQVASLSLLPTPVSCPGGMDGCLVALVNGWGGSLIYSWSNGESNASLGQLSAGEYGLTVTNEQGCALEGLALVETLPSFNLSLFSSPATCAQSQDGQAWVEVNGSGGPFLYLWENGQSTPPISGLSSGWYSLTVTNSWGCTQVDSVWVAAAAPLQWVIETMDVRCSGGSDGMATAVVSGGLPPYQYTYSMGGIGATAGQLPAGTYNLLISDSLGCMVSTSFQIEEPPLLELGLLVTGVSCYEGLDGAVHVEAAGGVPPYQYQWSTGATGASLQEVAAGNYEVTVTDSNGCLQLSSAVVSAPDSLFHSFLEVAPRCYSSSDGSLSVVIGGGTAPYVVNWGDGSAAPVRSNLPAGHYVVTIVDAKGCQSIGSAVLMPPEELRLLLEAEAETCLGFANGRIEAWVQGGVGPYIWSWSNAGTGPEQLGLAAGTYRVTVTDVQGCTVSGEETIFTAVTPFVDLGLDLKWKLGESLVLSAQHLYPDSSTLTYQWEGIGGDTSCIGCSWISFVPVQSGCQRLILSNEEGCIARDSVCITIDSRRELYIPNVFHPDKDGWNDFFTVYSDPSVKTLRRLSVYSRWGEEVFRANNIPTNEELLGWDGRHRGLDMLPGVYVYQVEVEFWDGELKWYSGDVTLVR